MDRLKRFTQFFLSELARRVEAWLDAMEQNTY